MSQFQQVNINNYNFNPLYYGGTSMDFLGTLSPGASSVDSMDLGMSLIYKDIQTLEQKSKPELEIIEQPTEKFRFRYKSEMAGTHGSLNGVNSDRSRKNTFPTVKLHNFYDDAIIRCTLYQVKTQQQQLHAHRLVVRYGSEEKDDPHEIKVSSDNNHTAVFQGMGIIHTAKKHLVEELVKKKLRVCEICGHVPNHKEKIEIKLESEAESKSMMLNSVCLGFEAFCINPMTKMYEKLCGPVFSDAINNLKSALTGELKIVRMDHVTTSCIGDQEIFILVEKVTKNNVKVRFFELDCDGNEIWSDYGRFSHNDVHHQYAIVFRAPPYKDQNIEEPVEVYIQLVRPSDGATSEPRNFKYKPSEKVGRKRFRYSESLPSSELPTTINNPSISNSYQSVEKLVKEVDLAFFQDSGNINSYEFKELFEEFGDPSLLYIDANGLTTDSLATKNPQMPSTQTHMEMLAKKVLYDLSMKLKTCPSTAVLEDYMKQLFYTLHINGNTVLHTAIICGQHRHLQYISILLSKMRHLKLTNIQNDKGETALHIAVLENLPDITKLLLESLETDPNIVDKHGNTPLHFAVNEKYDLQKYTTLLQLTKTDMKNYDGNTPLHIAIKNKDLAAVKLLVNAKSNINLIHDSYGYTPLHLAVAESAKDIVQYLLKHENVQLEKVSYNGDTPIELARNKCNEDDKEATEVYKILLEHYRLKGLEILLKRQIKEEADSDSEPDDPEVQIKTEPSSPMVYTADDIEFTDECIAQLSNILENTDKLELLKNALQYNCSSTRILLQYVNVNGIPVQKVRDILKEAGVQEAVDVIDKMLNDT